MLGKDCKCIFYVWLHQVTRLVENTEYMFRVCAENSEGVSKWLEAPKSVIAKNPYGESSIQLHYSHLKP